ncbi:hypothetical protein KVMX100_120090 [Klebsiella variicola]|nr:hypothetical protein KVMX100_120090 [Klebsiella variicola]
MPRRRVRRWRQRLRMASTSCCRRASRKSGGNGAPPCRSNPHDPFSCPGQRRGREDNQPHAPVSCTGAFVLNCAPFFSVVRCLWLKILSISLKRFSLKCVRQCPRISPSTTLSPPASARYAAVFASTR